MRRIVFLGLLAGVLPLTLEAQSSQFGIRGLGLPINPLSPAAVATGGAFGLFDFASSVNPAALGSANTFTALFTSAQNFRSSTNPFGHASGKDNRFPQISIAGPIGGTSLSAGFSLSAYTDRNFALGTSDTVILREVPVPVFDTLSSKGGLSDIRVGGAWEANSWLVLGLGLHAITGSNRIENRRTFSDSTYAIAVEQSDLSYLGFGVSTGAVVKLTPHLLLSGTYRNDGHLKVKRDSVRIGQTDLPVSWGLGLRWQPSLKTAWAVAYQRKSWSASDADIKAQGGIGAQDTYSISTGFEILKDVKNPGHRPWRLGASYATLPFPVLVGQHIHEFGLSAGTGFRFTGGKGGLDLALQQLWRSDGQNYSERATIITLGISIRP